MSFPPGTEMFQFPGFAFYPYAFRVEYSTRCQRTEAKHTRRPKSLDPSSGVRHLISDICEWVAPFGYPRINGRSPLPAAFRSVPRPSSPLGAKASTKCPSYPNACDLSSSTNPEPTPGRHHTPPDTRIPTVRLGRDERRPSPTLAPPVRDLVCTNLFTMSKNTNRTRASGDRTQDIVLVNRTLNHGPEYHLPGIRTLSTRTLKLLVEPAGIEPATPCLQSRCSPS